MSEIFIGACSSAPCSPKIDRKGRKKSTTKSDTPALQGMTKKWRIRRTSSVHVENPSKQLAHQHSSSKKMQLEDCTFNFTFSTYTETPLEIEFNNLNLNIMNMNPQTEQGRSASVGSSPATPRKEPAFIHNDLLVRKTLVKSASNPIASSCTLLKSSSDPLEDSSEPPSPFGSPSPSPVDGLLDKVEIYPLRPAVSLPPVTALLKSVDDRHNDCSCSCPHHSKQPFHYSPTNENFISWNQHPFPSKESVWNPNFTK